MGLFEGKRGIVFGVANRNSIAWGIARRLDQEGAELALHYATERFERGVSELGGSLVRTPLLLEADLTDDAAIERLYGRVAERWDSIDFVVHSVAHANREDMSGAFVDISRDGFKFALDVSAYSLIAVTRGALPLMPDGGSIVTMTYIASQRAFPGYNVMAIAKSALENIVRYLAYDLGSRNIRVNAISAGPVNTLAARGISGFRSFQERARDVAPLKRDVSLDEIGNAAVFLLGDLGTAVTGETIFVDAGYHVAGI
ncbi:MAG TPA: enoyl-ACP reductase [Chloroflexota bacterium]|nr:enoyl-ACP reductase [Chloroflexota bacterium]